MFTQSWIGMMLEVVALIIALRDEMGRAETPG